MKCEKCESTNIGAHDRNASKNRTRVKCRDCDHSWTVPDGEAPRGRSERTKPAVKPKVGMSLNDFRDKFDVDHIVQKTLGNLKPDMIYEKNDIIKLTGLRPGYPGLSPTIEDHKKYYGKVGSSMYFSHPDTINELKEHFENELNGSDLIG